LHISDGRVFVNGYGPDSTLEGTIGTQFTITGADFGIKKGKVLLGGVATKIAKDGWQPNSITCTVTKVPPPIGSYPSVFDITINPQPYKTVPPHHPHECLYRGESCG
jgi:hypothetical protein